MRREGKLRAFMVTTWAAEASVLVWQTSPAKAKAWALVTMWLDSSEWVDLQCKRVPDADYYKADPYIIGDEPTVDDCRLMWILGWHETEGNAQPCWICERYQWTVVPESHFSGDMPVCNECDEKAKTGLDPAAEA